MYGNKELSELLSHYAVSKTDIFKANRTSAAANIDFDKAKSEWSGFKDFMFQKCEDYYHFIDSKIAAVQSLGTRVKPLQQFSKRMQYVLSKVILGVISTDDPMGQLYPKLLFFVTHVKYIPNKCKLCWETFFKHEVDKNTSKKPTVPSKARSTSQNLHRVIQRWL